MMERVRIDTIIWYDASLMLPAQDGTYLVNLANDNYTNTTYTKEGGWNTFRDADGKVCSEYAFESVAYWTELPKKTEVLV